MAPLSQSIRSTSSLTALAICVAFAHLSACSRSEEAPAPPAAPAPQAAPQAAPEAAPEAAPQAAPQGDAQFRVTLIELGTAVGADNKVTDPGVSFKPSDTIYASITSEGTSASVPLRVRWTFENGQLVNDATQVIAPTGPTVTEFHISKPDGWPAGKYKIEVSAFDKLAGAAEFTVTD